jgi:hypothetical protein
MISALLLSAAAAAATAPNEPITLGNADQYCAFQYGWELATHNPLGNQASFEACLRQPPHRIKQVDGATVDAGEMFPPSACIPTETDPVCQSAR